MSRNVYIGSITSLSLKGEIHDQFKLSVLTDVQKNDRVDEKNLTVLWLSVNTDESFYKLDHVKLL